MPKCTTLCGMLVCRLMRRGSESARHAHLRFGRPARGRHWRKEEQHCCVAALCRVLIRNENQPPPHTLELSVWGEGRKVATGSYRC